MRTSVLDHGLKIFTMCPPSALAQPKTCIRELAEIARWSEEAGCEGILVFTDNAQLDPWLVSQLIVEATERLCPLVAIQPVYMHPYSAAKMVTSLAHLYGRRLYLNMVAGGFKNDLTALNDLTPHDERYARLVEYTTVVQRLLRTADPVSFFGSRHARGAAVGGHGYRIPEAAGRVCRHAGERRTERHPDRHHRPFRRCGSLVDRSRPVPGRP
jgi:alkanesulfonate monooxygenase